MDKFAKFPKTWKKELAPKPGIGDVKTLPYVSKSKPAPKPKFIRKKK